MPLMAVFRLAGLRRQNLWHKLISVFTVIIRPALNSRDLTGPVSVTWANRGSPFQRSSTPWVARRLLLPIPNAVEEVDHEQDLQCKNDNRCDGDELVHHAEMAERFKGIEAVIPSWHTSHTDIVHRPEDGVSTDHGSPEVDLSERVVHETPEHLWIPVVDTGKHTEHRCYTHHNVEVSNNEVSIVHLNINGRVPEEDTRQTTGDEHGNETDTERAMPQLNRILPP